MTEQVTVKTNVKRLSDPDAIAFAGTVIKGVYVDKVIAAAHPSMRRLCKPQWMI